jgi:hypothetical protein
MAVRNTDTVLDKGENGSGLILSRIADCVWTASRPRKIATLQQRAGRIEPPLIEHWCENVFYVFAQIL